MGCVYKLSFPNGKAYIGVTVREMSLRWRRHVYCSKNKEYQQPVHRAINKYGHENVVISFLYENIDDDFLFDLEVEEIRKAKETGLILYNMTSGGDGVSGYVLNEADRKKISSSLLGNTRTLGRKWTEEERLKRAANRKPISEETRQKLSTASTGKQACLGKTHSEEAKKLMSQNRTGSLNANSKLSEEQVIEIRKLLAQGKMHKEIAPLYGITTGTVSGIATKRLWSSVPDLD